MNKILRSLAAAGALVASLAASVPAQAAVIVGTFDPAVGPAIPGVGFKGSAQFFVDDACLLLSGFVANADSCSNNTMVVQTATVDFYDLANTNTILATLTFPGTSFIVNAVEVTSGEVTGFSTSFADPPQLLTLNDFIGTVSMGFALGDGPNFPGGVDLQLCTRTSTVCDFSNRATNVTFSRVPEPGTLSLLALAALGAAAATRRRQAA